MRQRTRKAPRLPLAASTALLVASLAALPAAGLVDLDLVVQMPLAVVEAEDLGYPRTDLGLLAEGLIAAELAPVEVIDVLRWAPLVWYLDELAEDGLLADDRPDRELRRLRLIEDRDGLWLVTTREDLVFVDVDAEVERRWLVEPELQGGERRVRADDDRDRRRPAAGLGAYVQVLLDDGLRGTELADEIHRELRRRGVPAGPKDRLDGPPPVSPVFVTDRMPAYLVVDGRRADLRVAPESGRWVPPGQARRLLARGEAVERRAGPPANAGEAVGRGRAARNGPPPHAGPPADAGPPPHAGAGRGDRDRGRGRATGRDDRGGGPPPDGVAP
ncbi:MAG TPA: hypothetical protein VM617_04745, partial [Thermoanaerobaculia bacterium]|nr:hypothetical protein [Thermoanaerobaculia bacterium]